MKKKNYILNSSDDGGPCFLAVLMIGCLLAICPVLLHNNAVNTFGQNGQGPCFALLPGNASVYAQRDPEKYSGYSTIIDTVMHDENGEPINTKKNKPQTMMINGKEYILK